MNHPNTFLIRRKALARFREKVPFLALIPSAIYQRLSPLSWHEPFGEIEQARRALEEQLDSYVMLYKRYGPKIAWEAQLFVYLFTFLPSRSIHNLMLLRFCKVLSMGANGSLHRQETASGLSVEGPWDRPARWTQIFIYG